MRLARRVVLRVLLRGATAMGIATVLYAGVLTFPEAFFGHELRSGNVVLYARRDMDSRILAPLDSAARLAQSSELRDPSVTFRIFELGSAGWNRFFNGPYAGGMARHSEIGGNIFVPMLNAAAGRIEHFDGRDAPLTAVLAHEMIHRLMQHRLGLVRTLCLPWWKREGYAEYVSERDSTPLDVRLAQAAAPSGLNDLRIPSRYFRALVATRYLLERRKLTLAEFLSDTVKSPI